MYRFVSGNRPDETPGTAGAEAERFFNEALLDFMGISGRDVPEPLQQGRQPAFRKGPHGKPYFSEPGLEEIFFSLSDTQGYKVLCFSDSEVGVDCENTAARPGIESRYGAIARRCFTDDEQEYMAFGTSDALSRFFEIWTAKEAYMKYTGNGFSEGFRSFSVFGLPEMDVVTGRLDGAPHVVYSICAGRGAIETPILNRIGPGRVSQPVV